MTDLHETSLPKKKVLDLASQQKTLVLKDYSLSYRTDRGTIPAVDEVNLQLYPGKITAIIGESGSGKSSIIKSILQLLPQNVIQKGSIQLSKEDITKVQGLRIQQIRGSKVAMVFQDALNALDPCFTIGQQMREIIKKNDKQIKRHQIKEKMFTLLKDVGLTNPPRILRAYPHELSGGMRQRVVIAMALSAKPEVILADEPTTALDVTIQAQILALFLDLKKNYQSSILLVTHDISIAASIADVIAVMYAGKIIESGNVKQVLKHPVHPYTQSLLKSMPSYEKRTFKLTAVPGSPPNLIDMNRSSCSFAPRCPHAENVCFTSYPEYKIYPNGQQVSCHLADSAVTEEKNEAR